MGLTKFACTNPDCDDPDTVFVALSCKTRGLCPSCGAKYMAKTAMHLEANVLPRVPYRQVVISFPKRIRCFLQRDAKRFRAVLRIVMRAIEAKVRACSLGAPPDARLGAILFPQIFGSSLNTHPHGHVVVTHGVFAQGKDGGLTFTQAQDFTKGQIAELTDTIRRRVLGYLVRHDCLDADDAKEMLSWDHHAGFSLDASVSVADHDRAGLRRLTRYCARHPFAKGRLRRASADRVVYQLEKPNVQGQAELVLSPLELLDKLAQFIIPPRRHRNIYWGAFAPHSKLRPFVVLTAGLDTDDNDGDIVFRKSADATDPSAIVPAPSATLNNADGDEQTTRRTCSSLWAVMLAKIYEVLPILCRHCGSEMKPVSVIVDSDSLTRICKHQGQPHGIPKLAPARGPPQSDFDFDD